MERDPVGPDAPLYATRPGRIERQDGGRWRWLDAADGASREIAPDLVRVAATCDRFATSASHADRVRLALGLAPDAATACVRAWIDAGIGIEARIWLAAAAGGGPGSLPEPLLVLRVFERPQGLRRLLDSIAADSRRHGVRHRCLVVDDTRDPAAARRTLEVLQACAPGSVAELRLLGPAERGAAIDWLLDAVPEVARDALQALLDPARPSAVTGSRTWNWAVLAAAGGTLSILDDDVLFPLRRAPEAQSSVQVWDSNEPDTRFYDEAEGWRAEAELEEEPYRWLGKWLGAPAGMVLARSGFDPAMLEGRRPAELAGLRDAPIVGAVPGLYGGIAYDNSAYLAYSNRWSQASLWRAPFRRERLEGDNLWHGYRAPRLVSHATYTPLLLDARGLLPFAGTWGRVDDTYFLMLLRAIAAPVLFAHLPVALGHVDLAPRQRLAQAQQPLRIDCNAYLADCFVRWSADMAEGARGERLLAVGARCAALAAEPEPVLAGQVHAFRAGLMQRLADHLDAALQRHPDADPAWREIVAGIVAANRGDAAVRPPDASELANHRRALAQVAAVAPHWPRLWERMRDGRAAFEGLLARVR